MNIFDKKHAPFSSVFPYVAVDSDMIVSVHPMRVTGIAEVYLSNYDEADTMQLRHDRLMSLFCEFSSNIIISIYYCKTFFPANPVLVQSCESDIVNHMERNKYDYVSAHNSPEYAVYISITVPVVVEDKGGSIVRHKKGKGVQDDFAGGLSNEEIVAYKAAQRELRSMFSSMSSLMGAPVLRLDNRQILLFLSKLINHEYVSTTGGLGDIMQSDWVSSVANIFDNKRFGYVHYNDNYHTVLSLRANQRDSKMPSNTHGGMNTIFFHKELYDIPFIIQHTLVIPERSVGLARARRRLSMIENRAGLASKLKFLEKTPEGLPPEKLRIIVSQAIEYVEATSHRFIEQFFHVHLWDKSLNALDKRYATFDSVVKMTYKMKREKFNIKSAYFSLFPGNEDMEKIRVMLPSFNISDFMPIDLPRWPYFDPKNEWELYYYNEMDSFCKIDLFDKRCSNYNAIVAGASGSGKSFSMQDMLWQAMKYDACIAIIDFGGEGMGSYLSFVKNLKGTYLEINLNKPVSLNPFAGRYFVWQELASNGEVLNERDAVVLVDEKGNKYIEPGGVPDGLKHTTLIATLERMFKGKQQDIQIPAIVRSAVVDRLRDYYKDEDNNVNNTCSLGDFAERYLKDRPEFTGDWDLYARLKDFIGEGERQGPYSRFFRGTSKFDNDDIICFDMAGLSAHAELKAVLIPALISMIMINILNNPAKRARKKLVVMDEAWRELQGGDMAQFMEEMFRTIRKLNGQVTIITQSIDDLLTSSSVNALMNNTSFFWLIGGTHNPAALRQVKAQGVGLSEYDINIITEMQNKRDMYLLTPFFSGKLRFYPTADFIMVATTDPNHRKEIDIVRRELGVDYTSPEVMNRLRGHKLFPERHHVTNR